MYINNPFNGAFGLDIGDLSMKLVELGAAYGKNKTPQYKIKKIATIQLPAGYIVNGEIQQPEMVRKKLLQLLGKEGDGPKVKSPYVVIDLPEPQTFLTTIEIDVAIKYLTKEDVVAQSTRHLPFDLNDAYIDYQIIGPGHNENSTRVLIGAVPKVIADSYTYLLESADLQPIAFEVESLSIARSLFHNFPEKPGIILDLGATRSAAIVYDKNGVCFSSSLAYSGELLNTAINQELKVDNTKAEEIRNKYGFTFVSEYPNYLKTLEELTQKLSEDVKKNIAYYQEHFIGAEKIEGLIMCGGLSQMANLSEALTKMLTIPCNPGDTWININKKNALPEYIKQGPGLSSAVGLAMRAAMNPYQE